MITIGNKNEAHVIITRHHTFLKIRFMEDTCEIEIETVSIGRADEISEAAEYIAHHIAERSSEAGQKVAKTRSDRVAAIVVQLNNVIAMKG